MDGGKVANGEERCRTFRNPASEPVLLRKDVLQRASERALLLDVGAVCGSAARTDLRGGHPVTGVPTATKAPIKTGRE